jgi:hypothetical protein
MPSYRHRVITEDRRYEFIAKGYKERHFFPHELRFLPKAGPGAVRLATAMCGIRDPGAQWEVLLHGMSPQIDEFPPELFFDDDIVWHKRQYGIDAHIALAFLVEDGDRIFGINYVSDVVQRITRRRGWKTRIEKLFGGWAYMLLNGILSFAGERNIRWFFSPTAELVMENSRPSGSELFHRVYDRTLPKLFDVRREGGWWVIDVQEALRKVVTPLVQVEQRPSKPTASLTFDVASVEGVGATPSGSERSQTRHPDGAMGIERGVGSPITYVTPRRWFPLVKELLGSEEKCLAFSAPAVDLGDPGQLRAELELCRRVSSRTKGYRLAGAREPGPSEAFELCYHKFDWILVGDLPAAFPTPRLDAGMVKIPLVATDADLRSNDLGRWVNQTLDRVRRGGPLALSLGRNWWTLKVERRRELLDRLLLSVELTTCDRLAEDWILRHGV